MGELMYQKHFAVWVAFIQLPMYPSLVYFCSNVP
jgi:hypothetical protein